MAHTFTETLLILYLFDLNCIHVPMHACMFQCIHRCHNKSITHVFIYVFMDFDMYVFLFGLECGRLNLVEIYVDLKYR